MQAADDSKDGAEGAETSAKKTPFGTIFGRAIRLRCPRCGGGRLFRGYFAMHENCQSCKLRYERGPGYFLGSTYINYGLTAVLMTVGFVLLRFVAGIDKNLLIVPLGIFVVLFPMLFFRYSRSLWLGMDCFIDKPEFRDEARPPDHTEEG